MSQKNQNKIKLIAENRRARYDYSLEAFYEAGIVLLGCEVKTLRVGRANIADGYAYTKGGEVFLSNAHIAEYSHATPLEAYNPRRVRKLLLKAQEIKKIERALTQKGLTLIPLRMFFNPRGFVKLDLALGRGKKRYDKRETQKKRDWTREKAKLLKHSSIDRK